MDKLLLFCSVFTFMAISNSKAQTFEFGEVSIEELKESKHPLEPDAKSAYLYNSGLAMLELNDGGSAFFLEKEVYKRIKIYDQDDASAGNVVIRLYNDRGTKEAVTKFKAGSYNLENGKVVYSGIEKKSQLDEVILSDNWRELKCAIPNIKDGTVIEVYYRVSSPFIFKIPKWYFQKYIPVNQAEYEVEIPSYFSYRGNTTGNLDIEVEEYDVPRTIPIGGSSVQYHGLIRKFSAKNLPSMKEEPFSMFLDDYRSGISYELMSTQLPYSTPENYTRTWNKIAEDLKLDTRFGGLLNRNFRSHKPFLDSCSSLSDEKKILQVFNMVQENYSWNTLYGFRAKEGVKSLLDKKTGNIAEINLLLVNLLKQVGIDAVPVIGKSRSKGMVYTNSPTLADLNYVLAGIRTATGWQFLDATDKDARVGSLPLRAINVFGVAIENNKGTVVEITNPNKKQTSTMAQINITEEGSVHIQESMRFSKESAISFDKYYRSVGGPNELMDDMEERQEDVEFESADVEYVSENPFVLKANFDYTHEGLTSQISGKLFLDSSLGTPGENENIFTNENRFSPIFFNHKIDENFIGMVNIPEGYQISSVPENMNISLPGNAASFTFNSSVTGDVLQINRRYKLNETILSASYFESIKEFYNLMVNKNNEKIVIERVP